MRRRWFTLRQHSGAALAAALAIPGVLLLSGAPTAAAAPVDTVLPGPVVGLTGAGVSGYVMVRTATDSPGITRFLGTGTGTGGRWPVCVRRPLAQRLDGSFGQRGSTVGSGQQ